MDNKKVLGISVVAVIVLVVAIIATSYATFTANLTGTKDNTIKTGYVTMRCDETVMTVSDSKPMTDSQGIAATNNVATCALSVDMHGTMEIGYDVGFDAVTPSTSLTTSGVKFQAYKQVGSTTASKTYLASSTATTGVTFADVASRAGTYVPATIDTYAIDSATVNSTKNIYYTIKAWVASEGAGSTSTTSNTDGTCSNPAYTDEDDCESHNEIWGTSQTVEQAGGSFSFKLKIASTQTGV